jgi:hypothetical protein
MERIGFIALGCAKMIIMHHMKLWRDKTCGNIHDERDI